MSLLVDLLANTFHLRDRVRLQNMREVVDVTGGVKLRDRFGMHGRR